MTTTTTTTPPARVRLTPLGGVGRFGRNCLCVEVEGGPAILVDCGVRFVAEEAPGFDVGLPDLERIDALGERLLGVIVTHGHEDHIGGLPYALADRPVPLWATPFTARLIERRYHRVGVDLPPIDVVHMGETRTMGPFSVTWLNVSHSIPDASCVVIDTPAGRIVHSGDFRVDDDPVLGDKTDLDGLTRAGDAGVSVLLADSTGALLTGRNPGERSVWPKLEDAVRGARGAVFVALFASHVQRLALIAEACRLTHRRLCLLGTGLKEMVKAARESNLEGTGALDAVLVDEGDTRNFPRERLLFAVTGSQGEPNSALARLAADENMVVSVAAGDRVIFSARVIPGNERRVLDLTEQLAERGVEIVDGRGAPHVSGHGYAGDLELLLAAVRPRTFVALHGNARNLLAHGGLARAAGLDKRHVVDLRDGSTLVISDGGGVEFLPGVRAHEPFAAYNAIEMFPKETVNARRRMGSAGVLVIVDDDPPQLVLRGISPALPAGVIRALHIEAPGALDVAGTTEEAGALKALARIFWRARRVPPEIVLVK